MKNSFKNIRKINNVTDVITHLSGLNIGALYHEYQTLTFMNIHSGTQCFNPFASSTKYMLNVSFDHPYSE